MNRRQMIGGIAAFPLLSAAAASAETFNAAESVRSLADAARRLYHDEQSGAAISDQLLAALRSGRFDGVAAPEDLVRRLNAEVAAASRDRHFMVVSGSMHAPPVPPTPPLSPVPPFTPAELDVLRPANFGIAAAELLPGNVGRLDLRQFYRPALEVRERLSAAMTMLSDSWAMIVDLSRNPGGDPHGVAMLLSYFFQREPFVVNRFYWRNGAVEEFRTSRDPGGPIYGEARPLVVLVSRSTWSAAEEFAYDIQALRRGILVGRVSGGGANHALPVAIAGGLTAFIPQARAENPVTRGNWEGSGVTPDIAVQGDGLLQAGHRVALERIAAAGDPVQQAVATRILARN